MTCGGCKSKWPDEDELLLIYFPNMKTENQIPPFPAPQKKKNLRTLQYFFGLLILSEII